MKKFLFLTILICLSASGFAQASLSGVVTYYFNEYQGVKPDIGASVILIDSSSVQNFNYGLYEKFYYGESYQDMYFGTMEIYASYSAAFDKTKKGKKYDEDREAFKKGMMDAEKDMERYIKELEKFEYDTPEKSAKIAVNLYMHLLKLPDDLPKKTVDSNGNYSFKVEPGVYYVYFKSQNRKGLTMPEIDGKIYIKKIKIKENEDKDLSYNFEP